MSWPDWRKKRTTNKQAKKDQKTKKSVLLNKKLILWEDPMAKKMLAASEFSPLESEMKVVDLQVVSSGAGGNLLDSYLYWAPARKSFFFPMGYFLALKKKQKRPHLYMMKKK